MILPGPQKTYQWTNGVDDKSRLSMGAYDMIGRLSLALWHKFLKPEIQLAMWNQEKRQRW
jgi:hypothetical protein